MSLIANLLTLHHADRQLRALRTRLDGAEAALAKSKHAEVDAGIRARELKVQAMQLRAAAANIEAESGSVQSRIERHREELNKSTNMRQYETLLADMKLQQDKRGELDSSALNFMEKADQLDTQVQAAAAEVSRRHHAMELAETELIERRADIGERLTELEVARDRAAADVPAVELALFNQLADATDGETMAEVVTVDAKRREFACAECNMELPTAIFSAVATHADAVFQCSTCRRILWLAAEPEQAEATV
ncbi:MAG: hypothetical protein O2819_02515 [Planctomycetota bacterium]|nr:hypothetical protein [Planctomycetota bacterium]MDA1105807.1 hypothetical protein [Planctomycetota bacterium]